MPRREAIKPTKRPREIYGIARAKYTIPDLWREMWAGAGETNRRIRWRRWDRNLDFN